MASVTNKKHWKRIGMLGAYHLIGGAITIGLLSLIGFETLHAGFVHMAVILGLMMYIMNLFRCPFCEKKLAKHKWYFSNSLFAHKNCQHCGEELP